MSTIHGHKPDWIVLDEEIDDDTVRRLERYRRRLRIKAWLRRPWRIPPRYPGYRVASFTPEGQTQRKKRRRA